MYVTLVTANCHSQQVTYGTYFLLERPTSEHSERTYLEPLTIQKSR